MRKLLDMYPYFYVADYSPEKKRWKIKKVENIFPLKLKTILKLKGDKDQIEIKFEKLHHLKKLFEDKEVKHSDYILIKNHIEGNIDLNIFYKNSKKFFEENNFPVIKLKYENHLEMKITSLRNLSDFELEKIRKYFLEYTQLFFNYLSANFEMKFTDTFYLENNYIYDLFINIGLVDDS
jgi:hypothetical protein